MKYAKTKAFKVIDLEWGKSLYNTSTVISQPLIFNFRGLHFSYAPSTQVYHLLHYVSTSIGTIAAKISPKFSQFGAPMSKNYNSNKINS